MRLRLLPAVFVIGATLLVLKGTDVTLEARAESTASDATPAAAPSPDQAADPAADDTQSSSAGEVDVLTSLAKRRAELDAREQSLDMRENLIKAAEGRVDGKITQLKQLQDQVQTLLVERDDAEAKQLAALVKTYSSMKPKDAAHIFNNLNDDVLLSVASQMKPDVLGGILAGMQADQAQKLTVRLANRLKLPEVAAQTPPPPAQQLAATTPPVTTPAPAAPAPIPAPQTQAPAAAPATSTPAPAAAATAAPVKK